MTSRVWQCSICHGDQDRRRVINELLARGVPHTSKNPATPGIEEQLRAQGMPVKRETIRQHMNVCVAHGVDRLIAPPKLTKRPADPSTAMTGGGLAGVPDLPDTDDFATLVKQAAVHKLKNGELRISTGDGLAAQALLDKRAEKAKDRDLAVRIGFLLAGALSAPPPMTAIEGEYEEIDSPVEELLLSSG